MKNSIRPYLNKITGESNVGFSVEKLVGDASSREYFRIELENHVNGLNSICLMKFNPDNAYVSDEASSETNETFPFLDVLHYLGKGNIRVPKFYGGKVSEGLLFFEDLGDVQFLQNVQAKDRAIQLEWYKKAVDVLVNFQKLNHEQETQDCIIFKRKFDYDLLMWECDHYLEWGIEELYKTKIPEADKLKFNKHFDDICSKLVSLPQIVVHRDFQSRNIMVTNNELCLIDFQDALMGPAPYDLVALLRDSYISLGEDLIEDIIDYYVDTYNKLFDTKIIRDEFYNAFLLQTVQRKLKDSGRFVFIDRVKKNPFFLQFIPDSLSYVKWALSRLPELAELSVLLGGYEERLKL